MVTTKEACLKQIRWWKHFNRLQKDIAEKDAEIDQLRTAIKGGVTTAIKVIENYEFRGSSADREELIAEIKKR